MGLFPSLIGRQTSSAAASVLIVPLNLGLKELIGWGEVINFFVSQEGHEAFLEDEEAPFNFAFGLGVRSDAMMDSQGSESALELGMSVNAIGRSTVAEQGEAIGIETGR